MPILQIDTYSKGIFESAMPFRDEDLNDRTDFATLPAEIAETCKGYVAAGAIPPVRQPTDGIVVTDNTVIVTLTWFNLEAAQEYVADKLSRNPLGLISSVVEVRD